MIRRYCSSTGTLGALIALSPHNNQSKMPASSKHKYSKILAFPDTYYELIINLLQSVELFCAYELKKILSDHEIPYPEEYEIE